LSQNTRDSKLSRGVSISPALQTVPGCDRWTDRRTDRITVANTCYCYASSRA